MTDTQIIKIDAKQKFPTKKNKIIKISADNDFRAILVKDEDEKEEDELFIKTQPTKEIFLNTDNYNYIVIEPVNETALVTMAYANEFTVNKPPTQKMDPKTTKYLLLGGGALILLIGIVMFVKMGKKSKENQTEIDI